MEKKTMRQGLPAAKHVDEDFPLTRSAATNGGRELVARDERPVALTL